MSTPLGDFLRERRDATRPEDVALDRGSRRRAPGLRRSELASLAGISVEYLVRLEQGRDRHPSAQIVTALADALRLGVADRQHLMRLATITEGSACRGAQLPPRDDVRPTVRAVLDQLEPGIAIVTNRLGDVLAHTAAFEMLAAPTGLFDTPSSSAAPASSGQPNLTRFVFTDPRARIVFPDWDRVADERAFDLWLGPSRTGSEAFTADLTRLAGDEFGKRRARTNPPPRTVLRWVHPLGELRFDRETLELSADDAQQIVVFLPADDATAQAVVTLRRDRPLRAVT